MRFDAKVSKKIFLLSFLCISFINGCSWNSNSVDDYGMLNLSTTPDKADVYMDKSFIGNTPMAALRIKTGKHLLRIEKKGYLTWEKQIQIFSFNEHNVVVELDKPPVADAQPTQNPTN